MSEYGVTAGSIPLVAGTWDDLSEQMATTSHALAGQGVGGLPPSVQAAASAFLTTWSTYAGESSTLADGFAKALRTTSAVYDRSDSLSEAELHRLDGRLGPER